jgi:hypothetical protein
VFVIEKYDVFKMEVGLAQRNPTFYDVFKMEVGLAQRNPTFSELVVEL